MMSTNHSHFSIPNSPSRPSLDATFSYAFRPFFLGAGAYAALLMSAWVIWIVSVRGGGGMAWPAIAGSPFAWHAHEMVYGFAAAAIGGFLLTAVPNWTGALPLSGLPLACLFAAWLMGRIAAWFSGLMPYPLFMLVDLIYLPLLAAFAARQLFLRPAARNLVFLVLIAVLTGCNVLFHLANAGYLEGDAIAPIREGLLILVVMIAIIGGRIIPAFTHNWLNVNHPAEPRPRRIPWLDNVAIGSLILFVILEPMNLAPAASGFVAAVAALAHGARLAFWRGLATRSEPILWILHIGYGWVVVGLACAALAAFTDLLPVGIVTHAFGAGAVGTMIFAVMTRASLGHTGRRLAAPPLIVKAYYLITAAALLRVAAPVLPTEVFYPVVAMAGFAWIGAFSLFLVVYTPILITPRVHTKLSGA